MATKQSEQIMRSWKRIRKYLESIKDSRDPLSIHKFRLEIKKIEALLFLVRSCEPDKKHRFDIKHTRKVFLYLGKIRTSMLNLNLAETYNLKNPSFFYSEQLKLEARLKIFQTYEAEYFSRIRKELEMLATKLPRIDTNLINKVYLRHYQKTVRLFRNSIQEEKLHKSRKKIKFLLYTSHLLSRKANQALEQELMHLDHLQELIGQWHDIVVLLELINSTGTKYTEMERELRKNLQQKFEAIKAFSSSLVPS